RRHVTEYKAFLDSIGVRAVAFVPVSGRLGENIVSRSEQMPWYSGATVKELIDGFESAPLPKERPFRMPVQAVYRFTRGGDRRRIVAGTIESGRLAVGDTVIFYPSGKRSRVRSIEAFNVPEPLKAVSAGEATGFTLEDELYIK